MNRLTIIIVSFLATTVFCQNKCQIRHRDDSTAEVICKDINSTDLPIDDIFTFEEDFPGFTLSVRRLEFKGCQIKNIRRNTFKLLPMVTQIILSNMSLETIENGAFQGIKRLKLLDLSDNRLTELPTLLPLGLRHLNLNNNPTLIKPTNGPLVNAKRLEWLSLQNCDIEHLSGSAFSQNPYLTHLDLSHNQLQQLPEQIFAPTSLTFIDLSYNQLKTISLSVFSNIPMHHQRLNEIILANNPWHCDCDLAPVIVWSTADIETHFPTSYPKRSRIHKETTCVSPTNLVGISWNEIKEWNCDI